MFNVLTASAALAAFAVVAFLLGTFVNGLVVKHFDVESAESVLDLFGIGFFAIIFGGSGRSCCCG